MITKILSLSFTLFLLMDSLGNVPLFMTILKNYSARRQRKIIVREMIIALGIIILFFLMGDILLTFLNVQPYTILISGGIILFLIALKMIFPHPEQKLSHSEKDKEPFIVPLATPLVAGPAALAAVMLYSKKEPHIIALIAICIAWLFSSIVLLSSSQLQKILGPRGLLASERLMGLILTLLAVQMFLQGMTSYISTSCR